MLLSSLVVYFILFFYFFVNWSCSKSKLCSWDLFYFFIFSLLMWEVNANATGGLRFHVVLVYLWYYLILLFFLDIILSWLPSVAFHGHFGLATYCLSTGSKIFVLLCCGVWFGNKLFFANIFFSLTIIRILKKVFCVF